MARNVLLFLATLPSSTTAARQVVVHAEQQFDVEADAEAKSQSVSQQTLGKIFGLSEINNGRINNGTEEQLEGYSVHQAFHHDETVVGLYWDVAKFDDVFFHQSEPSPGFTTFLEEYEQMALGIINNVLDSCSFSRAMEIEQILMQAEAFANSGYYVLGDGSFLPVYDPHAVERVGLTGIARSWNGRRLAELEHAESALEAWSDEIDDGSAQCNLDFIIENQLWEFEQAVDANEETRRFWQDLHDDDLGDYPFAAKVVAWASTIKVFANSPSAHEEFSLLAVLTEDPDPELSAAVDAWISVLHESGSMVPSEEALTNVAETW